MSESQKAARVRASVKYNKDHVKQVKINLNTKTDADIIEYLDGVENVQGTIKRLIRDEIQEVIVCPMKNSSISSSPD